MDKKARYGAPSSSTIERNIRKTNARAMNDLGFEPAEIAQILGFSTNTISAYLRETKGIHYSDTFEFAFKSFVFDNFTEEEQETLTDLKEAQEEARYLSKESKRTNKIAKGQGLFGWIHKKWLKDTQKYKEKNKEISKEIRKLMKSTRPLISKFKNSKQSPHLHKSLLKPTIEFNSN